jgi:hypothetical protein
MTEPRYISNALEVFDREPLLPGSPANIDSLAGTTLYGVDQPASDDYTKIQFWKGTGTTITLDTTIDDLDNTTALTAATYMHTIVLKNGVPLVPIDPAGGGSPSGSQFKVTGALQITLGTAAVDTDEFTIINGKTQGISTITGGALTAGRVYKEKMKRYLYSAGNVNVTRSP